MTFPADAPRKRIDFAFVRAAAGAAAEVLGACVLQTDTQPSGGGDSGNDLYMATDHNALLVDVRVHAQS
jgi:hypothetical protein